MIDSKFSAFHVGSRDVGIGFRILPAFAADICNILFDADADSIEQTRRAWQAASACETRVFPYCMSDRDGVEPLRINFDAYTNSMLPFNQAYGDYYTYYEAGRLDYILKEAVETMEVRWVQAHALDSLLRSSKLGHFVPDFLSLDTQGTEYRILRGARTALRGHVIGVQLEAEFVPIYEGQELFRDLQPMLEDAGFRLAGLELHDGSSSFRGRIGARARGFLSSGDALFLRRWETLEDAVPDVDRRYMMLHKLAFASIVFERLEYALEVLQAADRLRPSPAVVESLEERGYFRFLRELRDAVAALPQKLPPTMREAMTFEEAQARFK